jgi:hypothetical protein
LDENTDPVVAMLVQRHHDSKIETLRDVLAEIVRFWDAPDFKFSLRNRIQFMIDEEERGLLEALQRAEPRIAEYIANMKPPF